MERQALFPKCNSMFIWYFPFYSVSRISGKIGSPSSLLSTFNSLRVTTLQWEDSSRRRYSVEEPFLVFTLFKRNTKEEYTRWRRKHSRHIWICCKACCCWWDSCVLNILVAPLRRTNLRGSSPTLQMLSSWANTLLLSFCELEYLIHMIFCKCNVSIRAQYLVEPKKTKTWTIFLMICKTSVAISFRKAATESGISQKSELNPTVAERTLDSTLLQSGCAQSSVLTEYYSKHLYGQDHSQH